MSNFLRAHEFHLQVLEIEDRFTNLRLGELATIDRRTCRRIDMVDSAGGTVAPCVDESDGLPLALGAGSGRDPCEIQGLEDH